ncbi:MAG: tetratricopeptide repeat protein [Ignavibacteria bacterium]|nr:tetratricopeptide repeat protein [Ignavibacteria bacterium]
MIVKADSNMAGYNNNYMRREANYYEGLCQSRMNNLDEALRLYGITMDICKTTDKEGEESPYYVFSALGSAVIYDQKGNRSEAIKLYDRILNMRDIDNSRETAQKFKDKGLN